VKISSKWNCSVGLSREHKVNDFYSLPPLRLLCNVYVSISLSVCLFVCKQDYWKCRVSFRRRLLKLLNDHWPCYMPNFALLSPGVFRVPVILTFNIFLLFVTNSVYVMYRPNAFFFAFYITIDYRHSSVVCVHFEQSRKCFVVREILNQLRVETVWCNVIFL